MNIRTITPGIPNIPVINALTRFISREKPKYPPIKLTRNSSINPTTALIKSLKIRRIGAERILIRAKITSAARINIRTEFKASTFLPPKKTGLQDKLTALKRIILLFPLQRVLPLQQQPEIQEHLQTLRLRRLQAAHPKRRQTPLPCRTVLRLLQ